MRKCRIWLLAAGVLMAGMLAGCGSGNTQAADAAQTGSAAQAPGDTQETNAAQGTSAAQAVSSAQAAVSGEEAEAGAENSSSAPAENAAEEGKPDGTDAAGEAGNTLVVYFSATGNTERVAEMIAEAAGGDLFELEPVEPYTDEDLNYRDDNSRTSKEYADASLREVELIAATVDGFSEYEHIFVGYPIWWGVAAWPVDTFVKANDFTGKTVIPFCTSGSSGLGRSGELLAEMAGSGEWLEGMRFGSSVSEEDVAAWVEGLGL